MKKVISLIVAFAIVACCFVGVSAESEDVVVTGEGGKIKPGETIIVKWFFHINNGENVAAFDAEVDFDDENLELVSQDKRNPDDKDKAFKTNTAELSEATSESYTFLWNAGVKPVLGGFTCANGFDEWTNDIWWFSAQFKAKDDAEGDYPVTITFPNIGNADATSITCEVTDAVITVEGDPVEGTIKAIDALPLPADIELDDDKAKVEAARAKYDALDPTDQAKVTNIQKLVDCEARIAELEQAKSDAEDFDALVDEITAADKANKQKIIDARDAYDVLSDDAKKFVTKEETLAGFETLLLANEVAAAAVDAAIAALPEAVDVTLDHKNDIEAARAAYDELSDDAETFVENLSKLEACEQALKDLAWKAVKDAIDALPLPADITLADKDAVVACRTAFEELSPEDQAKVTNIQKLVFCETRISELAVQDVIDAIEDLPLPAAITLDNKSAVEAVRAKYDALTPDEQAKVTNYQKLVFCETRIADLEQAVIDAAAFDAMVDKITAADKENEQKIIDARDAYDKLSDDAKNFVTKEATLAGFETLLLANEVAAATVDAEIDAIGTVTLDSETAIDDARTSYNALSPDAKTFVEKLNVLEAAEARLAELKQAKADAEAVDAQITAITAADKANEQKIIDARNAFNALSPDAKGFVENEQALIGFENSLIVNKAAAKEVDDAFNALPELEKITVADKEAVENVRTKFDAITSDEQKSFLETTEEKIAAVEAALKNAEDNKEIDEAAAKEVDDAIAALPEVEKITLADEEKVVAARASFNGLTYQGKTFVENIAKLEAAEEKIEQLKATQSETKEESKAESNPNVNPGSSDNYKTGDASSVAVAGALCAAMALAFVATKKKFH